MSSGNLPLTRGLFNRRAASPRVRQTEILPWPKLDLTPVLFIKRAIDKQSFTCLGVRGTGAPPYDLGQVLNIDLPSTTAYYPIVEFLRYGGCLSIHDFCRRGKGRNPHFAPRSRIWNPCRKESAIRHLNACFAEWDFAASMERSAAATVELRQQIYKSKCGLVKKILRQQVKRGAILPPSLLWFTGRSLWALWLLHGDDPSMPVYAWPDVVDFWKRIQDKLINRFQRIPALAAEIDTQVKRVTETLRIPGSINHRAGFAVKWKPWKRNEAPRYYPIEEIADWLEVPKKRRQRSKSGKRRNLPTLQDRARKGHLGLWYRRHADFQVLLDLRHGAIEEGCRHFAVLVYAIILGKVGWSQDEAFGFCRDFNRQHCTPAIYDSQVRQQVKSAFKYFVDPSKQLTDQKIEEWLKITDDERRIIAAKRPPRRTKPPGKRSRQEINRMAEERQRQEKEIIRKLRRVPSLREMADELKKVGIKTDHMTVSRDYRRLGYLRVH